MRKPKSFSKLAVMSEIAQPFLLVAADLILTYLFSMEAQKIDFVRRQPETFFQIPPTKGSCQKLLLFVWRHLFLDNVNALFASGGKNLLFAISRAHDKGIELKRHFRACFGRLSSF